MTRDFESLNPGSNPGTTSWGYSSVVEQSTADRQVTSSNLVVPLGLAAYGSIQQQFQNIFVYGRASCLNAATLRVWSNGQDFWVFT